MTNTMAKSASPKRAGTALLFGGIAAVLASTCCLGPLVLLLLGVSGAWIGQLTALEPYRPGFISMALVALFFAWRNLWPSTRRCTDGASCAGPRVQRRYRQLFGVVVVLVVIALGFPVVAPWLY